MSFQAMAWAIEQRTGSPTAKLLLLILCNYADNDGVCWPSQQTLAEDTEMTDRTIRTALGTLIERQLVSVEHRPGTGGGRKTNVYRISLPEKFSESRWGNRKNLQGQPEAEAGQPEKSSDKPIIEPIKDTKGSPAAELELVVSAETASAIIEHRQRVRAPLTARAAKALAKQLAKWPNPEEAAAAMLSRGWRGFEPEWMPKQPERKASVFPMPAWKPGRLA